MSQPQQPVADVCLVLEGTYPYVAGGVSTWVHQIISELSDVSFAIVYIGSEKDPDAGYRYELPPNIVSVHEVYLFPDVENQVTGRKARDTGFTQVHEALTRFLLSESGPAGGDDLFNAVAAIAPTMPFDAFWNSAATWEILESSYRRFLPRESYLDFFWSSRFLVAPLWELLSSSEELPAARIYHSLCTGYAGTLGAVLARRGGVPLLLSEHGIYVRERIADLQQAEWFHEHTPLWPDAEAVSGGLRKMWIEFFKLLGTHAYDQATTITALFANNAALQEDYGAAREKIAITPNGIDLEAFRSRGKKGKRPLTVGFLGRVVPIKDLRTLLQSAALVHRQLPDVRFVVAGPTDEDEDYYAGCLELRERLGLAQVVDFPGPQDPAAFLGTVDVMLLTSVSEGLPFVVLEAFAAAIPVVSTDVGACRELIEGQSGETPNLGAAGAVAPAGDPAALAAALSGMLSDPKLRKTMGAAARARVERYYDETATVGTYRELYASI